MLHFMTYILQHQYGDISKSVNLWIRYLQFTLFLQIVTRHTYYKRIKTMSAVLYATLVYKLCCSIIHEIDITCSCNGCVFHCAAKAIVVVLQYLAFVTWDYLLVRPIQMIFHLLVVSRRLFFIDDNKIKTLSLPKQFSVLVIEWFGYQSYIDIRGTTTQNLWSVRIVLK